MSFSLNKRFSGKKTNFSSFNTIQFCESDKLNANAKMIFGPLSLNLPFKKGFLDINLKMKIKVHSIVLKDNRHSQITGDD